MRSGGMTLRQYTITGRLSLCVSFAGTSKFLVERGIANKLSDDGWMSRHIHHPWSKIADTLPETLMGPGKPLIPKWSRISKVIQYYQTQNLENESENIDISRHLQKNLFTFWNEEMYRRLQDKLPVTHLATTDRS